MACSEGRRPLGAALHSPDEPSELSQWPGHDDSTINIVMVIIIIIIIIIIMEVVVATKLWNVYLATVSLPLAAYQHCFYSHIPFLVAKQQSRC